MLSIMEDAEEAVPVTVPAAAEPLEAETRDELTTVHIFALEGEEAEGWDEGAIAQLGWDRFNVTDPEDFKAVDDAYIAGDYDAAKELIVKWKKSRSIEKVDTQQANNEGFEGPNASKKKRKLQTPAGREQDYGDIRSDSSSVAFDSGVMNDANALIDRV